ncbi:Na+/H+ antiporter subunit E [Nannocystis pusilla]|uniref:Na+/H+ antiporter subunit E n=1 Tax=Nannocystis pusilla TaxID=889268 RepID=A0A9X3ENS6_9BACT|nr:Na+/H+ antiporter subunit E [Nannocystis pusilla]MCY1007534.1 Na+/H+ antiporter subunit E [Nannocystis pusilla]
MMRALSLVILLAGYWALLSGQFHNNFLIACGVVCIAFVVWMASRMGLVDDEGVPARYYVGLLLYVPYIVWQVILANWDVLKRIWAADMPIDPRLTRIPYSTRAGFVTVTYANSITLTPGTVTMQVTQTEMLIHSLTKEGEDSLFEGDMERHCKRLEGG